MQVNFMNYYFEKIDLRYNYYFKKLDLEENEMLLLGREKRV